MIFFARENGEMLFHVEKFYDVFFYIQGAVIFDSMLYPGYSLKNTYVLDVLHFKTNCPF